MIRRLAVIVDPVVSSRDVAAGEGDDVRGEPVRHASHLGRAATDACRVAMRLARRLPPGVGRIGVVCNGGPSSLEAGWLLASRAHENGPASINPLRFPATLTSHVATAAAAAIGAHAFALAAGHDRFAFFHTLATAGRFLHADFADAVVVLGISSANPVVAHASCRAGLPPPADVAIGFVLTTDLSHSELHLSAAELRPASQPPSAHRGYVARVVDDRLSASYLSADTDALGATGAVLCAAAIKQEYERPPVRGERFSVSLVDGPRVGHAEFEWASTGGIS